ncbi:hypothetical protein [Asticcacaulis sp. YBE204]|uniref:hypothetical protein n=1 Tax=Asticcacaulis sp. YBE204 TaxID=1282363 RepID=UPI0003C4021B|nr:hypothetical protein [Asticcacaulis sp. YBE204]ESQ79415.1 hypothetical protein AEYBE204_10435 [Asticcacaulis sp. YBE204]
MLKPILILSALILLSAYAHVPEPPKVVVDAAMKLYFDYDYSDPDNAEAPRAAPDQTRHFLKLKVLRPVYFTGNSAPDWMIDVDAEPTAAWCGTGGCALQIWRQGASGEYNKVFDQQVREWKLKPRSGERDRILWVDLHGTSCGSFGSDPCPFAFEWSPEGYVEASPEFTTRMVVRGGPLPQAVYGSNLVNAPPPLRQKAESAQAACVSAGADLFGSFAVVNRAPDLNGDGIGEWSFDNASSYCTFPNDVDYLNTQAFDSCTVMECSNVLFLSEKRHDGVHWRRMDLGRALYGFKIEAGGFKLVRITPKPGNDSESDEPCGSYLKNCVVEDLPITPYSATN